MAQVPKRRKDGQTGGSAYNKVNRSTHASARVHQKAAKKGCALALVVSLGLGTAGVFQGAYEAYGLFSLMS
jgi:hypothetical protein